MHFAEKKQKSPNNIEYNQKSLTVGTPYKTKFTDPGNYYLLAVGCVLIIHIVLIVAVKKAKRKRNITKADIGVPQEFRHVTHIGFDPDKGFEWNSDDMQLHEFFIKVLINKYYFFLKLSNSLLFRLVYLHNN